MHVRTLALSEFRNYRQLQLTIPAEGLRIVGKNASGKTSLLEAIVMLATTRSDRTTTDRDVINTGSGVDYGVAPYARIEADLDTAAGTRHLELTFEGPADGAIRKRYRVDGQAVRAHDLIGIAKVVVFSPEDVELVTGPPAVRRRQLDVLLSQIDRRYLQALTTYTRVMGQRNGLLRSFSRDGVPPTSESAIAQLAFWDDQLVASGAKVVAIRAITVQQLSALIEERSTIMVDGHIVGMVYEAKVVPDMPVTVDSDSETVAGHVEGVFRRELEQLRAEEFRRGTTMTGPQRDDLRFTLDGAPLAVFGSRGQQRLGVIALKLSEGDLIQVACGDRPIVLLDDVLSELDDTHRRMLLTTLSGERCQIIVTSATDASLDYPELGRLPVRRVIEGDLMPVQAFALERRNDHQP